MISWEKNFSKQETQSNSLAQGQGTGSGRSPDLAGGRILGTTSPTSLEVIRQKGCGKDSGGPEPIFYVTFWDFQGTLMNKGMSDQNIPWAYLSLRRRRCAGCHLEDTREGGLGELPSR